MSLNLALGFSEFNLKMASRADQRSYEFGDFRLEVDHLMLSRGDTEISLAPKAVETLLALIERRGEIVSKNELLDAVWPDTAVDESNLFLYLSILRKALGTQPDGQPWIETLRRRGYRFWGKVSITDKIMRGSTRKNLHVDGRSQPVSSYSPYNQASSTPTVSLSAFESYLRGSDAMKLYSLRSTSIGELAQAIRYFKAAISSDPKFALAYSLLGGCYLYRLTKGLGTNRDIDLAQAALDKALALDSRLTTALAFRSYVYLLRGEKLLAHKGITRAIRAAPDDPIIQMFAGVFYQKSGSYDRALRSWEAMVRLDPTTQAFAHCNRSRIFVYTGKFDTAFIELKNAQTVDNSYPSIRFFEAFALFHFGNVRRAASLLSDLVDEQINQAYRPYLAMSLIKLGQLDEAKGHITSGLVDLATTDSDVAYWLASAHLMLKEIPEALEWLRRSIQLGNDNLPWLKSNPTWRGLLSDSRFQSLIAEVESNLISIRLAHQSFDTERMPD